MSRMRVLVQGYGDNTSASARIRLWTRLASVEDLVEMTVFSGNEDPGDYDVVYVQKRVNNVVFELVKKSHQRGKKVVFDIDDHLGCSASEEVNIRMLGMADMVTTDTRFKEEIFKRHTKKPIKVIPDGVDYFMRWKDVTVQPVVRNACTFGWDHNISAAMQGMKSLSSVVPVSYIGYREMPSYGFAKFIKWSLPSFIDDLRKFDCAFLAHGDAENDRLRCCNRFMTASFAGLLTLVRDTLEYRETLELLGVPQLLVKDSENIADKAIRLSVERPEIVGKLRKQIWERYQPRNGGLALYNVFNEAINARV